MNAGGYSARPRASTLLIVAAAGLALALRLPLLGDRPLHTDEAVQGMFFGELLEEGRYVYNPFEYHGPTLYYFTLPVAWARGQFRVADVAETTLRLVPLIAGALLVLLVRQLRHDLRPAETGAAALLAAVSPVLVYFSRYYVQEMLLVLFSFGLLVSLWRYHRSRRRLWIGWAGAFAGMMHATKETCLIVFAAMAAAWWLTRPRRDWFRLPRIPLSHLALGAGLALLVSALFYSSFFTNARGPWDSLVALLPFSDKAAGTAHDKPWFYYLRMLVWWKEGGLAWHELPVTVLALAGALAVARGGAADPAARLRRVVAVYAGLMLAAYTAIPYKTPWLILGPLHGLVLLGGIGFGRLWDARAGLPWRAALLAGLAAASWASGRLAWRGATRFGADERNPCAYSHTSRDCLRLVERVKAVSALAPAGEPFVVKIGAPEYWPLPWYFRGLPYVGYTNRLPPDLAASVLIVGAEAQAEAERRAPRPCHWDMFGLRPGLVLAVGIREDLWSAFIATRAAATTPAPPPEVRRFHHRAMWTQFEIQTAGADAAAARQAADDAFELIDRLDAQMTRFDPSSEISALSRQPAGQPLKVLPETVACLEVAKRMHAQTFGAFEPTIGRLLACWRDDEGRPLTPSDDQLDAARAATGMQWVDLDPPSLTVTLRRDGLTFDLGGIAKGFALDAAVDRLQEWKIGRALLSSGGSTVLALDGPDERGWALGLGPGAKYGTVRLRHRAMGASGPAEQGAHIIDPRTGRPAAGRWYAWSFALTGAEADALSTAFLILSRDEIARVCAARPDVSAAILDKPDAPRPEFLGAPVDYTPPRP